MTIKDIETFLLKGDIQDAIEYDIKPILHLNKKPGGYFGAPRQILCMIDFLGALYCGSKKATSHTAIKFIKKVLGSDDIDPAYKKNGRVLYKMYRDGLVHLYQPKKLILPDNRKVEWCVYKGKRLQRFIKVKSDLKEYKIRNPKHLEIVEHPAMETNRYILLISINCLYEDLKRGIDKYLSLMKKESNFVDKWNKTATYICEYERLV